MSAEMSELVGTPLWQEDSTTATGMAPAKSVAPMWQQEVVDAEGKRRFHGAFTGGYSAGYFNSVGSKEGWAPKEFKSSRGARTEGVVKQVAEDFMDEDDLQSFGGKTLEANSEFDTIGSTRADLQRQAEALKSSSRGAVIPGDVPEELVGHQPPSQ
jgi:G patch domain-containing protein 1